MYTWVIQFIYIGVFRSLDRLILNFHLFIVKLKPLLSCKIAEIALGGNGDIMRPKPTLVYVMQYNLDILIIVIVTRKY